MIYHGLQLFGGGGTLAGLMLGAIAAFIIDRKFDRAALYALAAAVLAFFGFINGTALAFANSAPVALGYLLIALMCVGLSRYPAAVELPLAEAWRRSRRNELGRAVTRPDREAA